MTNLLNIQKYKEDIVMVGELLLPWDKLQDASILITGGTGMLGSFLIDVIMYQNRCHNRNCHIYTVGRNTSKAKQRFGNYFRSKNFTFIQCDINNHDFVKLLPERTDYIFHAASNTHPIAYATDPIGTITANIFATYNLLKYGADCDCRRFVLASSNEIYGENRGDVELFDEDYCGYINSNTVRAGYPESKRCSESLCQAFISQNKTDAVIVRFTRSYGPTLLTSDTKAMTQFIRNGLNGEDIVLKSEGNQYYSYTYEADAISGMLTVTLKGACGEAYNVAHEASDITLKELAHIIAEKAGTKVIFDLPSETEKAGFSKVTKARLNGHKLMQLGWQPKYDIKEGISRTIDILRENEL